MIKKVKKNWINWLTDGIVYFAVFSIVVGVGNWLSLLDPLIKMALR